MKSEKSVIMQLNNVLANELIAINQYFLHARMFKNWGFNKLNSADYKRSIQAMKNADYLMERILFLEGLPNVQDLGRLMIGEDSEEMIGANLKLEMQSLPTLKDAIKHCEDHNDYISRKLLTEILTSAEAHIDWLEEQQGLIKSIGIKNYLQSQC
ncbi:bacterioferritin [Flocculibacter collagenilyticus]|uniref:bacterioferritin n=1 Tax=Flocculibacter collagenilyticus TaxID=2744479 RepID=UPI0018F4FC31|nr:bacterioferritin [Flocculibacter collagenilyticus]